MRIQDWTLGFDNNVSHAASMPGNQSIRLSLQWATKNSCIMISYQNYYLVTVENSKETKIIVNLYYLIGIRLNSLLISLKAFDSHTVKCCFYANFIKWGKQGLGVEYLVQGEWESQDLKPGSPGYKGQTLSTKSYWLSRGKDIPYTEISIEFIIYVFCLVVIF